jgi:hypothetical protein
MDMGKPNVRLAAEAAIRSKARPVVVVTGCKRAAVEAALADLDVAGWRVAGGACGRGVRARVPASMGGYVGRRRAMIAVRRGAYSIAFPIDKVLAQFPGKIMVKPGESYPQPASRPSRPSKRLG